MTTDTEALRQAFEDYINPEGDVALHWQPAGYYAGSGLQGSWIDFQSGYWAGHAAAKAATAAPVVGRWYFVSNDGVATLCVDEADARESASEADIAFPRMAPHRAVQLVPADQLAEAQREAVTLAQYLYNACYSHEPDYASGKVKWEPCDTPAGVITQIDNMVAGVRAKLAEAQRDSERLDWMIEQRAYVVSDPDCCDGYWLNYPRKDGTLWTQATEHETPRAAIDAAKGER